MGHVRLVPDGLTGVTSSVTTDWDEVEFEDARERRRASARAQRQPDQAATYRSWVLDSLYARVQIRPKIDRDGEYIIPSWVATRLGIEAWAAAEALRALAAEGFVEGPIDLPKTEEDGSPIRYTTAKGRVEWDGKRWVTSIDQFALQNWKRIGWKYVRLSKKEVAKNVRRAERARKPVNFDGRGFRLLEDGRPYIEYGEQLGKLSEELRVRRELRDNPPKETCPRCLSVVEYRMRHGKRRRDHGKKQCDLMLVRHIMES